MTHETKTIDFQYKLYNVCDFLKSKLLLVMSEENIGIFMALV